MASKLTKSVRQAKESAANQHDGTGPDQEHPAPEPQAPQENKAAVNPVQETEPPKNRKRPEPEAPIVPLPPSRRVWPD